ncbi:hypothetical protein RHO15_08970 [Utexia brackfieldae]
MTLSRGWQSFRFHYLNQPNHTRSNQQQTMSHKQYGGSTLPDWLENE